MNLPDFSIILSPNPWIYFGILVSFWDGEKFSGAKLLVSGARVYLNKNAGGHVSAPVATWSFHAAAAKARWIRWIQRADSWKMGGSRN